MKTFKRLFVSVKSHIDQVTEGCENYEALAGAAILEMEACKKRTHRHLFRLSQEITRQRQGLEKLEQDAGKWRERAIRIRERDEARALACVRRLTATEERIALARQALANTERQREQAQRDLEKIESKIVSLRNRKLILAARQSHGQMQSAILSICEDGQALEALFDRWEETVVVEGGFDSEAPAPEPDLEEIFHQEEEEAALRARLDDLTKKQAPGRNG